MKQIVRIDIDSPGAYESFLAGWEKKDFIGTPLLFGYKIKDMACGILVADYVGKVAVLKWIAVDEICQGRGIGTRLWKAFYNIVADAGVTCVDTVVCLPAREAKRAEAFLEHRGFQKTEVKESYSFCIEAVSGGSLSKLFGNKDMHMHTLQEAAPYQIRNYNQRMIEDDDGNFMSIVPEELLPESIVWIEDEKIKGCVLLAACGNGIELRMLSGNGSQMLALMLAKACKNLADRYPMDTKIYVAALVNSAKQLVEKLAGNNIVVENLISHYVKEWE